MLIMAYQALEGYDAPLFKSLTRLFSKTALEVCEGQQLDVDFETMETVAEETYLKMIGLKTAVLVAGALKMGAMVAGAPQEEQDKMYSFGMLLGLAFQIQDDYLDAFGNPKNFGKTVGGDITNNKKTLMYIKALELGTPAQQKSLKDLFSLQPQDPTHKIAEVKALFDVTGAAKAMQDSIVSNTDNAFEVLNTMAITEAKKQLLKDFGVQLMGRSS